MDHNTFMKTLDYIFTKTQSTLLKKSHEYSSFEDKLHNFRAAAALRGCSLEDAAFGFLTKHLVSLSDMCKTEEKEYSSDVWEEKLGDSINYLIFIWAMIREKELKLHDFKINDSTTNDERIVSPSEYVFKATSTIT